MSTLKVNKLRDTAGSADAITLDPNGGAVLAGVTTVTSVNVGAAVTISESGIEATGVGITCANINGAQIGGRRNIIINGAMMVAQRGTSSTETSGGYFTVDRLRSSVGGADEAPTMSQVDVSSGTDPYKSGFRKAYRVTNGNQTSGAGASDYIQIDYYVEAQDVAKSGWDYTNPNSFVTLSFWMKSSVATAFPVTFRTMDGTSQAFNMSTGSLTADTWTKVIKTIPGNSNLQFNNDNGRGIRMMFFPWIGTTYTTDGLTLDTWSAWSDPKHSFELATTWWTTNDATWEITGLQLEVGSQATAFEHRSFGEELQLCHRYYYDYLYKESNNQYGTTNANRSLGVVMGWSATEVDHPVKFSTPMRAIPSLDQSTGSNYFQIEGAGASSTYVDGTWTLQFGNVNGCNIYATPDTNVTSGNIYHGVARNTAAQISFEAEL